MLFPIKILDFDLAAGRHDTAVTPNYRAARVLVRWSGVPVGTVHVPVCSGRVRRADIAAGILRHLSSTIGREAARRALLDADLPEPLRLPDRWQRPLDRPASLPGISLVICSRDRPADLRLCLSAVSRLAPAPLEVIVVDNAPSTEATADLIHAEYPSIRYVREDRPGLDHARNRGIQEARGGIIAFTDDDVIVDSGWIGALAAAFAANPAVGLVTGLIEPWELETEAQVLFEAYGGFGRGYLRRAVQVRPGSPVPWELIGAGQLGAGANMAVRRTIFDTIGAFDPALDVGTPTRGGGDHEIFFRLIKSGCLCLYEPAALVRHRHRRTRPELERLLHDYGRATRCFFERTAREFPEDARATRRLHRWWLREWALRRWWHAWMRPASFPPDLVRAEIRGYLRARGAYARARAAIVIDEAARPDFFHRPDQPLPRAVPSVGFVAVDVAEPLRELTEGRDFDHLHVIVRHHGQTLGSIRVASHGSTIAAERLADLIAGACWVRLLNPFDHDELNAWVSFQADLANLLAPPPALVRGLPESVTVTVVVATCDRPDSLRRCLRSLAALRARRLIQTIVVDNRPSSGTAAAVLEDFPGVERVTEWRRGSSYARNAGIAAARGDLVVMTDDDMEVSPDWLEQLVAPFARADVLAVTGNTLPARVETDAERTFETYGGFGRGFVPRIFDRSWFLYHRRRAVPTWQIGGSGNAAFRTEIFSWPQIGGFDERLGSGVPTGVGEDTKLFYDILNAGYSIAYQPGAVAWHHHRVSMGALRRQLYGYSRGHVAYHLITLREHGDKRALVRLAVELPLDHLRRAWRRLRGGYAYPWHLLLIEIAGTLAGPWSLWAAARNARRLGRGARRHRAGTAPAPLRPAGGTSLEAAR